jgi:hypothetical protein
VTGANPGLARLLRRLRSWQGAAEPCRHDPRRPSRGCALSQRLHRAPPVAPHGFGAPSSSLQADSPTGGVRLTDPSIRPAGPRGLPGDASRGRRTGPGDAHGVTPSAGYDPLRPPRCERAPLARAARARAVPPVEFLPLRRMRRTESTHSAGVASPGYVPPPGFCTLLTVCSSARPPSLFHPGGAHGVRSSEPSSRSTSRDASRRPLPS